MGLWSKVSGWGMMIGGVALAGPTGGASLAMVPAGASILSADEKKDAAKQAGAQLEDASAQAIATQAQARDQAAAAFQPYTQTGSAAMGALGSFMGLPPGGAGAGSPMTGAPAGGAASVGALPAGTQQGLGVRAASPTPATGTAVPRPPGAATPQTQGQQQTASSYAPLGGAAGGGLVQMRAPTGQTSWVPRAQAPFYAQRGAVEVG